MKTTIDIADALLETAKATAARENRTLRDLVEQGLRLVLASRRTKGEPFRLRDASFKGMGLQSGIDLGHSDQLLADSYEGRGG